jgi:hypothetical protein
MEARSKQLSYRVPARVITRPLPELPATHYWLLGKPRAPAVDELARLIRLTARHRPRARL